ncbi:myoD family inhibitor domain-containing protein 2 [Betta splendens]|uniref:MyoD family inhibitor domain-containing protein 2 n=1 Tax=Betta splendens TaxID=158456 RepID=A0A9W2XU35_BETSP|nr:myoD family inhibitor domain-containing protein 2 [Betta splendens]
MQTDTQTKTEASKDSATQRSRECSLSSSPLFSLKMYLQRSSSTDSSIGASLSSSQQTSTVDCAGMVLSCLFCRFYDLMFMLPDSCGRFANHCCPNRKQVAPTAESTPSTDEDFWTEMDCGLFTSCHDANDCLELAMEVSELCYH